MPVEELNTIFGEGQLFIEWDGERIPMGLATFGELTPAELPDDYGELIGRIQPGEAEFTLPVAYGTALEKLLRRKQNRKMSRKRFIKLLMGVGVERNTAVIVTRLLPIYGSYAEMWRMIGFKF